MTKKDYTAIADIICNHRTKLALAYTDDRAVIVPTYVIDRLVDDLCIYFKEDNINFNLSKFKAACKR